jgi:hypothetical protein
MESLDKLKVSVSSKRVFILVGKINPMSMVLLFSMIIRILIMISSIIFGER